MLVQRNQGVFEAEPRVPATDETIWIHLVNAGEAEISFVLQDILELHPLAIEDAHHFRQRAKVDLYRHWTRPHALVSFYAVTDKLEPVELCLLIGSDFFVSLTQASVPWLDELYQRAANQAFTFESPAAILYRILDGCADTFTVQMNSLQERVDTMERRIFRHPEHDIASTVFQLRRRLHELHKISEDEAATMSNLKPETFPFVDPHYEVYFHDVVDHLNRATGNIDVSRDTLRTLLDFQAMQRAARLNDVMKTLAIISTIFLPLSFIVGLYGMNFHDIPELSWPFGYIYVWCLLIAVAAFFIGYFKWKRWW